MNSVKKDKEKQYNKQYYSKTREKRRNKEKCTFCGRMVCSEYLLKHTYRDICLNARSKE